MKGSSASRPLLAAALVCATACVDVDAPPMGCEVRTCHALVLAITTPGPIVGDTVRIVASSDSDYDRGVTWAITGPAELVPGSELRKSDPGLGFQEPSVLVKGLAAGKATVTATHVNPYRTMSITITVSDSSIITKLGLTSVTSAGYTTTTRIGDSLLVYSWPTDSLNNRYLVSPDRWSTSDTTIATVSAGSRTPGSRWVKGKAPGTVYVIAGFAARKDSIRITVNP